MTQSLYLFIRHTFSVSYMAQLLPCCSWWSGEFTLFWQQNLPLLQTEVERYASSHHMGPTALCTQNKEELRPTEPRKVERFPANVQGWVYGSGRPRVHFMVWCWPCVCPLWSISRSWTVRDIEAGFQVHPEISDPVLTSADSCLCMCWFMALNRMCNMPKVQRLLLSVLHAPHSPFLPHLHAMHRPLPLLKARCVHLQWLYSFFTFL